MSCSFCATKWTSPHDEDSSVYNLIYSNDDTPGYSRYKEFSKEILTATNPLTFLSTKEEMYYGVAKSIVKSVQKGGAILDVGCGLGYMTYALASAGYKATGLDISSEAIQEATKKYGQHFVNKDFFEFEGIEGGYDAICMLELIEHVKDPREYIKQALRLLKPKGVLILTTPNRSWYPLGSTWDTDLPPVHLTWFSEKGITEFAKKLNLTTSFFSFSFYNFFYGTLQKPSIPNRVVRGTFFTQDGKVLYSRYMKSGLRIKAERLGVYRFLKTVLRIGHKLRDYARVLLSPKSFCLSQSNVICVTLRRN
jgi:SAM-dependent methyltransferase